VQIFDALGPLLPRPQTLWSEPVARELLEAGSVLHDIGYIINYAGHHKHGYHLIVHSDLSGENGGFSRREVEIIANLARYHRRSSPKLGHPNFKALSEDDRCLVLCLSAILRIADGLDRTHSQNIRAVKVRLDCGNAIFDLEADRDPATDAWGASRKSDLFKEVFGVEPMFEWSGKPISSGETSADLPAFASALR
jgi:exopolyphosphatase/guanosine-5'-triphosphate,3'-diphosphate pyrophosphatase